MLAPQKRPSTLDRRFPLALFAACCLLFGRAQAFDSVQLKTDVLLASAPKTFTPAGVAVDHDGRIWVTNSESHELLLFSRDGAILQHIGKRGSRPGEFQQPHGIAIDSSGQIYVADSGNNRVQAFSADGKWLGAFGEKGNGPGQFNTPWTLAASHDGDLVIGEKDQSRLQLFSRDGVFLNAFDTGSAIDGLAINAGGKIYASHAKSHVVDQWSAAGQMLKSITGVEAGSKSFAAPTDIAIAASGIVYVTDRSLSQFRELDGAGHTLGTFGRPGSGDGQFKSLSGVAVNGDSLYVGDSKNHRVVILTLDRSSALPSLFRSPTQRLQVSRGLLLPQGADRVACTADGLVHALSFSRADITSFDADGKIVQTLDLKKIAGVRSPSGLAIAPASGSFFISDAGNKRVIKIDRHGKLLLEFGKSQHLFKGTEGELSDPQGLACSGQGVLYVADTGNSRFQTFNHQGLFQFSAGEKGSEFGLLKMPTSLALDKEALYIADPANHKVLVYGPTGRFLREFGSIGPEALVEPRQIALDHEGNLFVLDVPRGRVLAYDPQGVFLGAFGSVGESEGFLNKPRGLATGEHGDLFVAEENRIQRFHVTLLPPPPGGLTATTGEGYVALRWDAVHTRFPPRYIVYRSSPTGDTQRVKETIDTAWTDDQLTAETTFTYMVAAQSAQGATSGPSAAVQAMASALTGPRLEIVSAQIDDIFSAHYKYYGRVPAGHVVIKNNGLGPIQKLKVGFAIQGFMDYPSEISIPELHAGEEKDVAMRPTFNNRILDVSETTPIQAQITLAFTSGDKESLVNRNLPFKLYSRNSIRWLNKETVAAFVTPNDPPVIDFARGAVTPFADAHESAPVPTPLLRAWALFEGLGTYGISYVPRPNNPYDRVSLDSSTVDTVQFARETLARKSGDCADVVVLLASVLESLTVTTVALDAPGHLFLMFDTGVRSQEALGFPADRVVRYAGSYWIPLEATMLGSPFLDAWKQGAQEYHRWADKGQVTPIDIHEAWKTYEPATLREMAGGPKAPARQAVEAKFLPDWKALVNLRWQTSVAAANQAATANGSGDPWLQLGLIAVEFHRYDEAKENFNKARKDPSSAAAAFNNLGNLALLKGDLPGSETLYKDSMQIDPADAEVSINLARVYLKSKLRSKALTAFSHAMGLDPSLREQYPDLSALLP